MQSRRTLARRAPAALALAAALCAAPRLAAQAPAAADSVLGPHRLTTVVVTASAHESFAHKVWRKIGERAELTALDRDNRQLERQLRAHDRRIAFLEGYLARIKAPRDSINRQIAMLDSATAAIGARRRLLEARVRALELAGGGTE
jgi:septal ring factor EnvC (AmiA/AmiB activator)